MEVLDRNPALKKRLFQSMVDMGIEPGRYIVGNELNSRNPVTGQPEFFLKKIVSQIRKALPGDTEKFLGPAVGILTGNPFAGAIAGGIGAGTSGALTGGLAGLGSPGMKQLGGFNVPFASDKAQATTLMELLKGGGAGEDAFRGLFGTGGDFKFRQGTVADALGLGDKGDANKRLIDEADELLAKVKLSNPESELTFTDALNLIVERGAGKKDLFELARDYGVPFITLAELFKSGEPSGDVGVSQYQFTPTGEEFEGGVFEAAKGGITDLRQGGMSLGPGTETSDDIPAMLSDGEFVMTAKAVRGAGGGDRREGAKKMYEAMDRLEAQA